jgi:glycerol-3-phosphate cytidylyltransferase
VNSWWRPYGRCSSTTAFEEPVADACLPLSALGDSGFRKRETRLVVGVLAGSFDLFHAGHVSALHSAAAGCERLIVGVASDELIVDERGVAPIVGASERMEIVAAVRGVDVVTMLHGADLVEFARSHGASMVYLTDAEPYPVRRPDSERALRDAGLTVRRLLMPQPQVADEVRRALGYLDERTVA